MKEIAENYGLLFDPLSVETIKQTIIKLHSDKYLQLQLKEKV